MIKLSMNIKNGPASEVVWCVAIKESLGTFAGTAAVRCDVAAPAITGAKLLRNGLENVTFTGRQLETASLQVMEAQGPLYGEKSEFAFGTLSANKGG